MKTGIETELDIVAFSSHLASVAPFPACKLRPNSFLAGKKCFADLPIHQACHQTLPLVYNATP